jgi:capsular exopolysaccharide synthesis family protein
MAKKNGKTIFDLYNPESPVGTEFRRLLHNVTRTTEGEPRRSFMVTSAMLAEGKSTVSSFLAITAATYKHRSTILVDCDLRRPSIHRLFDVPRQPGLTDVISGQVSAEDAFQETRFEHLKILTAGTPRRNPTALFEGRQVGELIEQLKFYFDLVIVDSPPIIPVSDPIMLAPELDGILLVVKAGTTQREVVKRACTIISKTEGHILGVALNNMKAVLPYYYNHRYYGYSYSAREQLR